MALRTKVTRIAKKTLLVGASRLPLRPGLRVLAYHEFPPIQEFEAQLDLLTSHTRVINESELLRALSGERPWPTNDLEVLITADDGYACQFTDEYNAAFASRGLQPIIFLIGVALAPDELARHPRLEHDEHGRPRPLVSKSALEEGIAAGWTVAGHTWTHPNAAQLVEHEIDEEIVAGANRVEQILQTEISTFAWPWGKLQDRSAEAAARVEARFKAAFSTHRGPTLAKPGGNHFIRRDTVDRSMSVTDVRGMLAGALDRVTQQG